MKNLVIVESPAKARKLSGFLGKDFLVEASVGHIRDLPKKLGVDVENNFEPTYEVVEGKKKVVTALKKAAKIADKIYLAMDPDREGEAIAWHVKYLIENGKSKKGQEFLRATFHEITKSAVLKAMENPGKIALNLVDAQQARRILDRLVGYKISPVLWKKIRRGLSAGRVQSPALRLIVEREKEIEAFKPDEYWEVDVALSIEDKKAVDLFEEGKLPDELPHDVLVGSVVELDAGKYEPTSEKDVTDVVAALKTSKYQIIEVEKKERRRWSLPPFTTSTLQQQAAHRLGFTSKQTMMLAQQLYEDGLITYHRTDSNNLSQGAIKMARDYIGSQYGANYVPKKPRVFVNKSKNAQEAHEAIRVTKITVTADQVQARSAKFTVRHQRLYDLIWRRFVASQMERAVYDQTKIMIEATSVAGQISQQPASQPAKEKKGYKKAMLKSNGSILKFDGWMRLFPSGTDTLLPDVKKKQNLYYQDLFAAQKFTQPPARFNDASLVKELEKLGIGRPSTYASIISVIEDRGYVEREDKKFKPTAIGTTVSDFLVKNFTDIVNYDFTAEMEEDLDRIARGEKKWRSVLEVFYKPFEKNIDKVLEKAERAQIPVEKLNKPCPDCGNSDSKDERGELVIRTGKFGKFISCSRFPDCKFTENIVEKLEGQLCPLCQKGDVIIKPSRWGKSFFGCSNYPDCDWASWSKPDPDLRVTKEEWKIQQKAREERKKVRAERNKKGAKNKLKKTDKKTPAKKTKKSKVKKAKK
ncbi:type I DNA topoisomerase [Patescibacteria group bacterium]|nr:type I DNA topoisomerase [Patescibacteria group bacterium]